MLNMNMDDEAFTWKTKTEKDTSMVHYHIKIETLWGIGPYHIEMIWD